MPSKACSPTTSCTSARLRRRWPRAAPRVARRPRAARRAADRDQAAPRRLLTNARAARIHAADRTRALPAADPQDARRLPRTTRPADRRSPRAPPTAVPLRRGRRTERHAEPPTRGRRPRIGTAAHNAGIALEALTRYAINDPRRARARNGLRTAPRNRHHAGHSDTQSNSPPGTCRLALTAARQVRGQEESRDRPPPVGFRHQSRSLMVEGRTSQIVHGSGKRGGP